MQTTSWMLLAAVCGATASLFVADHPWVWLGLSASLAAASGAVVSHRRALRRGWTLVAAATLTMAGAEGIFAIRSATAPEETYGGTYATAEYWNEDDPVLGYGPRAGVVGTSSKFLAGREVYRVAYTIAHDGLRRTASTYPGATPNCLLFFGDSFMFGEGLNDKDTLPWIAQEQGGAEWSAFNFGFHGYGAHQMLATIEADRVRKAAGPCPGRRLAIIQFSEQHVARSLGRAAWDRDGPRYVLDQRGNAVRTGNFDVHPSVAGRVLQGRFRPEMVKWLDWQRLFRISDSGRQLFVALVATSCDQLAGTYPGGECHLILLDPVPSTMVTRELTRRNVHVHPIGMIVPEWRPGHPDYTIAGDGHPNRRYNEAVASWIARELLRLK